MFCWQCIVVYPYSKANGMQFLYSIYYELTASTSFEHYLLIFRRRFTNNAWYVACVLWLLAANPGTANRHNTHATVVCAEPPEDEKVVLETRRGREIIINWIQKLHPFGVTILKSWDTKGNRYLKKYNFVTLCLQNRKKLATRTYTKECYLRPTYVCNHINKMSSTENW
jgi:hypothetical protein